MQQSKHIANQTLEVSSSGKLLATLHRQKCYTWRGEEINRRKTRNPTHSFENADLMKLYANVPGCGL